MSGFLGVLFPGGGSGGLPPVTPSVYLAYGGVTASKRISIYNWDSSTGFGSIFANSSIPNNIDQVSFVRDNSVFSASFAAAPYFSVWKWSGLGYGTQYSNPASSLNPSSGGPAGFTWTNAIDAIITSNVTASSYPQAWAWSQSSGFGTKYSNGSYISNFVPTTGISLNGDNTQVAFSGSGSSIISLYQWSSATGFGTKYANATSPPATTSYQGSLSFNLITNDIAVGGTGNQKILAYAVTLSGFGSRYSDPSSTMTGSVFSVGFISNGSAIAIGGNSLAQPLSIYQWGAGFGSLYSGPNLSQQAVYSANWSSTGTEIATAQPSASPYTKVFSWTPSGVGSAYSNPGTAPGIPKSVSFSNQSR
jgi:hypothetical protein